MDGTPKSRFQVESEKFVICSQEEHAEPCAPTERPEALIVATCACGQSFTQSEWDALPLVGTQETGDPEHLEGCADCDCNDCTFQGDASYLELRNCPCGSTRAILKS